MIRAAALTSPQLQRVLALLSDGKPHTTRDFVRRTRVNRRPPGEDGTLRRD